MNKPLVFITFAFCAGIALSAALHLHFVIPLILCVLCAGALYFPKIRESAYYPLLLYFLLGASVYSFNSGFFPRNHIVDIIKDNPGQVKSFTARVLELPEENEARVFFIAGVEQVNTAQSSVKNLTGRVRVAVEKNLPVDVSYGDTLIISAPLLVPEPAMNKGQFDYAKYLANKKVYYTCYAKAQDVQKIKSGGAPFLRASFAMRKKLVEIIKTCVPGEAAGITEGIMLGNSRAIEPAVYDKFRMTGTVHILAVSGMNAGLVALFIFLVLKIFRVKIKPAAIVTLVSVAFFAAITGSDSSIVRAAIMSACVLAGYIIERDTDVLNSLAAAALIILIFSPSDLFDAGFQLSFLATFGIVYLNDFFLKIFEGTNKIAVTTIATSLSAQLFVTPVLANTFHQISLISILANVVIVPLSSAITILGFAMWFAGLVHIGIAKIFGASIWALVKVMGMSVDFFSSIPYASVSSRSLPIIFILLYYLFLFVLPHADMDGKIKKIPLKITAGAVLALWFFAHLFLPTGRAYCYIFSAKNIDGMFFSAGNGKNILALNAEEMRTASPVRNLVTPFLRYRGVNSIDHLVLFGMKNKEAIDMLSLNFMIKNISADYYTAESLTRMGVKAESIAGTANYNLAKGVNTYVDNVSCEVVHKGKSFICSKFLTPRMYGADKYAHPCYFSPKEAVAAAKEAFVIVNSAPKGWGKAGAFIEGENIWDLAKLGGWEWVEGRQNAKGKR